MLRDLESLLLTIQDDDGRSYMTEAVRCYNAGAYRAAVVMATAAGMDDLRKKLQTLASSGGANAALRASAQEVERLFNQQDCYERRAIIAAEIDASFINPSQAKVLNLLFNLRNLCAHPSGHVATAEEARHAITTMIDLIMARPALFGIVAVDTIVQRMDSASFFPTTDRAGLLTTIQHETASLHSSLYTALVSRAARIIDTATAAAVQAGSTGTAPAPRTTLHLNAVRLLVGMVLTGGAIRDSVWRASSLTTLALRAEPYLDVLDLVRVDPSGLGIIDQLTRGRILQLIRSNLQKKEGRRAANSIRSHLSDGEREDLYERALASTVRAWPPDVSTQVREIGWDRLDRAFFEELIERCGSGTWDKANPAIDTVQAMAADEAARVPPDLRTRYVLNVADNATGVYAAKKAQPLLKNGLGPRADFVDAFIETCRTQPDMLHQTRKNLEAVAQILDATGRQDAILALLEVFRGYDADRRSGYQAYGLFVTLSQSKDQAIAALAVELRRAVDSRAQATHPPASQPAGGS